MGLSNSLPSSVLKPGVCTSGNRPAQPYVGQFIYQTDNGALLVWDGSSWAIPSGPSSNPTSSNQFARKQYVDTQIAQVGTWQGYTPAITSSGTAPSWGTPPFLFGYYSRVGNTVTGYMRCVVGSSPTVGTGTYYISLPVTANVRGANNPCGTFWYSDSSTSADFTGLAVVTTGGVMFMQGSGSTSTSRISATNPGLGAGDSINISFAYEAA
jgi:hypothetical protein